ncbi:MAG TPA: hypothetical protein VGD39_13945 [Nocardioides sp.]
MTDSPGLPPEQERVRRLLADARHAGPTPPEVVARLDETLASLVAERGGAPLEDAPREDGRSRPDRDSAPVVDLGARRRRMVGVGLLAAAAVVVAGVGIGQVVPDMQGSDDSSASGGVASDSGGTSRELGDQSDDAGADAGSGSAEAPESMKSQAPQPGLPAISLTDPDLSSRLLDLRRDAATRTRGQPLTPDVLGTCLMRGIGPGRRLLVDVDGEPGAVVYRRPSGDTQEAAIFVCGSGESVRTLTLPAP